MSDDAKKVLGEVDALVAGGRRRDRMNAARLEAIAEGRDPELAAREVARDPDKPVVHPVTARRDRAINAALNAGRITPAETARIREAMNADEQAAMKLLERMPEGRLPLEPKAHVPDPENPAGSGELPAHMSLLSASQRDELARRRAS